jgi:plastocyanin
MTMARAPRRGSGRPQFLLRAAGAVLLAATGVIHLHLYLTGYRSIPTIGPLFLLQVIASFVLAIAVAVSGNRLVAAAGAVFSVSTLGGYVLSIWVGLFGFQETRTTWGIVAGVIEVAAFGVLAAVALMPTPRQAQPGAHARPPDADGPSARQLSGAGGTSLLAAGGALVALIVLGVSVAHASSPAPGGSSTPPGGKVGLTVVIKNFKFIPATPHVTPGERVEVKNEDNVPHTMTAGPNGRFANVFNTGQISPGKVGFFTAPKQAGAYPFYCKVHHFMTGMLQVGSSSAIAQKVAAFTAAKVLRAAPLCGSPPGRRPHLEAKAKGRLH